MWKFFVCLQSLEWREKNSADKVLTKELPEYFFSELPHQVVGHDKEGCVSKSKISVPKFSPLSSVHKCSFCVMQTVCFSCKFLCFSVCVVPLGKWDLKKTMEMGYRELYYQYVIQILERGVAYGKHKSLRNEMFSTQFVLIFDFEGFSLSQVLSQAGKF